MKRIPWAQWAFWRRNYCCWYMTGYAVSRDLGTSKSPQKIFVHRTRNERVGVCNERVGVLFFSGMCRLMWGLVQRLRGPYVIPRPGVPPHMICDQPIMYEYVYLDISHKQQTTHQLKSKIIFFFYWRYELSRTLPLFFFYFLGDPQKHMVIAWYLQMSIIKFGQTNNKTFLLSILSG